MKETDLAKIFAKHLTDFELYYEVKVRGHIIDIVAVKPPLTIAIEVKTSLGFSVLEQAVRNIPYVNYSYVAVPYSSINIFKERICLSQGIGVLSASSIEWTDHSFVEERVKPKMNRKAFTDQLCLQDFHKENVPGVVHNRTTAFGNMVEQITKYVKKYPGARYKDVYDHIEVTYDTYSVFRSAIYGWVKNGVIKDFYIDKGRFYLRKHCGNV